MMKCGSVQPGMCDTVLPGPSMESMCNASAFFTFMSILDTCIRAKEVISGRCERINPIERTDSDYDFIVIGGGAGGAVTAARLSEVPDWKVLLLEAGDDESGAGQVPAFAWSLIGAENDWNFQTNESNACLSTNGFCTWHSSRTLGGNTAHNDMVYLRGNPTDYNNWAAMGNEGWSYEDVLPFFKKSEDNGEIDRVGRKHHGTGGPLRVQRFPYNDSFSFAILAAAEEAGFGISDDLNGEKITGFTNIQTTQKDGVRRSSARSFLWPARNRKNLHISLNSYVTRIIIENNLAVGVEYHKNGKLNTVRATREIVLSGGIVKSPHLLLLSGIGPKEHLESMGIKVVKDLPGVGKNLHDQVAYILSFTINESDTYENNWAAASEYLAFQTGPLSSTGLAQISSSLPTSLTTADYPDTQLSPIGYEANCAPGEPDALRSTDKRTIRMYVGHMHPKSRGRVCLASKDPFDQPFISANYLSEPSDVQGLIEGIEMTLALTRTKALRAHNFTLFDTNIEACSNYTFASTEYWACAVRQDTIVELHQAGSCKMGPASDSLAVVDPRLRVHGVKGLRVVDASIMPQVTSANTGSPTMMIGERGADFIKQYWTDGSLDNERK
ncbi:glucose dehydrogenase [FAD, quinone]-like [Neodiprion virginianus]|uniref:glucose dehydrogenase [FAD, quinone]-like n=1 Tax=Neodiprion virginianus TaxID=2961670 RepID=UPI001EE73879|nr:glucose dehydrogenase [FAD, quinone]-like [Neodiprion virginianus]